MKLLALFLIVLLISGANTITASMGLKDIKDVDLSQDDVYELTKTLPFMSTFLGGENNDGDFYTGNNVILDSNGNVIIAGTTKSNEFPITANAFTTEYCGNGDVFIAKMNANLTRLLSSTIIGGSGIDEARGIEVDTVGNIYIAGITESSDFPIIQNGYQNSYNGGTYSPYGSGDAFVIKLDNDLSHLLSATFLGGTGHECCNALDIDSVGKIYVTGGTSSNDFPTTNNAYDRTYHSGGHFGDDAYISVFSSNLSDLLFSTYIGGTEDDFCEQLAISNNGDIYIGGWTSSNDFPTTLNAFDRNYGAGYYDAFVSRFSADLTNLVSSTYLGGRAWDFCYGLTTDNARNVYITGHTASTNFPITSGAYCIEYQGNGGPNVGDDTFISKFNADLSELLASTYLGGNAWENGYSIVVDNEGHIFISGTTSSADFPTTPGVVDDTYTGGEKHSGDAFISKLDTSLSSLMSSTYLGESGNEVMGQLMLDQGGNLYVAGSTGSEDFIVTDTSYDTSYNGGTADAFVVYIDASLSISKPNTPSQPEGPSTGRIGKTYEYSGVTTDKNSDDLFYIFDWGDGNYSEWLGPYTSGEVCTTSHSWFTQANYNIRVKAKNTQGFESDWSQPLPVSMPLLHKTLLEKIMTWFACFVECIILPYSPYH